VLLHYPHHCAHSQTTDRSSEQTVLTRHVQNACYEPLLDGSSAARPRTNCAPAGVESQGGKPIHAPTTYGSVGLILGERGKVV
jgi:hypothetical protein